MGSTTVNLGDCVFHEIEKAKEEGVTCAHLSSLFKAAEIEIRRCLLDLSGMGLVVQHDNNWKLKRQYEEDEAVSAVQRDIGQLSLGGEEQNHRREVVPRRQSVERPRRVSSTPDGTLTAGQRGNQPSMTSRSSFPAELASRTRLTSRSLLQLQESRTHMAVATRPSTEMICSNTDVEINKNAIGKIAQVLSVAKDAMLAKDIAQRSGLGQSKKDVNRWLYFMEKQNKVEQVDNKRWRLKETLSSSDIDFMSAELAKKSPSKKKADDCECENRGPGCQHHHYHQTVENHQHFNNYQLGDNNQINIAAASGNPIPTTEPPGRRS